VVFVTDGLNTPSGPYYIKRLIGMPGDTLKIVDSVIFVQEKQSGKFVPITDFKNKSINKIYEMKGAYHGHLPEGLLSDEKEFHVPENHYFMMGDNSSNSYDSRRFGVVPRQNIVGKAFFIFWPFSRRWGMPDGAKPLDFNTFSVESPMEYQ
jgi:signal peptidase I